MPLKGIKVIEFIGLAPAPMCGKILSDFGATVTRIDKILNNHLDVLQHGKRTLVVNLKNTKGQALLRALSKQCDVIIEPFRPGVMERLNLGPELLCAENPRLIYARLTGFGQHGRLAARAGHDINYSAVSGVLSMLGRYRTKPMPPINLLADFAGGSFMCALGICIALLERHRSGCGQVVDAAMVDGAAYLSSWVLMSQKLPLWGNERGRNALDGGLYFYDIYETKDGKYMSVGALEPQFFELLRRYLKLPQLKQTITDEEEHKTLKEQVRLKFLEKTQKEWSSIFQDIDACVFPVLEYHEVAEYGHNKDRNTFQVVDGVIAPAPAPRLSRTPGKSVPEIDKTEEGAFEILKEIKLTSNEIMNLVQDGAILLPKIKANL